MCGIAGLIERGNSQPQQLHLKSMAQILSHRGPDADGIYLNGPVGMAHTRLSIIDLEGGLQPMSLPNGNITITYNGEIYNYLDLKKDLEKQGCVFSTRCDTEVLLHLWEQKGPDMLDDLWGMFSFAIHDIRKNCVFMAVDRFGQKPLYHTTTPTGFAFASEPRALASLPGVSHDIDEFALHHYLSYLVTSPPRTLYKHIHKLPAGHSLTLDLNTFECCENLWYHLDGSQQSSLSYGEAQEELRHLLTDATRRRLMSDVPLGTFLSGGVDSTIVTGLVASLSTQPVKTFTIGSDVAAWDERDMARRASQQLGTQHFEKTVEACDTNLFEKLMRHMGEPFADSSLLPTSLVCQHAREHVTVALSGDGADEGFGGYGRYRAMQLASSLDSLPRGLRNGILKTILALTPIEKEDRTLLRKLRRFCTVAQHDGLERYLAIMSHFSEIDKHHLYNDALSEKLVTAYSLNVLEADFARGRDSNIINRVMNLDVNRYLQDDILVKVDRASMLHSLEVRSPFMDHRVLEFAAGLPLDYKLKGAQFKRLLKDTFSDLLPAGHAQAPKRGFAVPLGQWFRGPMKDFAFDLLTDPTAANRGLFEPRAVTALLEDHLKKRSDHGQKIWALCALEAWLRNNKQA